MARRGPRIPFKFGHGSNTVAHDVSKTKVCGEAPASNRKEVMLMSNTTKTEESPEQKPTLVSRFAHSKEWLEVSEMFVNPVLVLILCLTFGGGFRERSPLRRERFAFARYRQPLTSADLRVIATARR